jgi:8-oxo-dGTP diphosphatase
VDVTEQRGAEAVPIYLVRHAKAKNRLGWTELDDLRPLTKSGRWQAEALVALYADQRFWRLLSSPYLRCVQTLEPLAAARGLPLETVPELAEGAPADEALELMLSMAEDGSAVLSTHGDVMMDAVEQVLVGGIPRQGPFEFKKGATWVFEVRSGAFAGARYLPPPGA